MADSESESESDDEISATLSMDPLVLLKVMSDISRMESPSINQSMTRLLSSLSIKDAKLSQETPITNRKRSSTETRTDTDEKSKRRRATNARNIAEEDEPVNKKCMCHLCYRDFHNESNLSRHLSNSNIHQNKYCVDYSEGSKKFRCGYCGKLLCNKGNVNRHINTKHTKEAKYKRKYNTKRNNVDTKLKEQKADVDRKCHYLLLCAECEVATPDITRAVEHSQLHQMSDYNSFPRTCENCEYTFEDRNFEEHTSIHNVPDLFIINYNPTNLLTCEWADIFQGLNCNLANQMKSTNIYEHTRKVKMNTDDVDEDVVSGKPLYQCEMCGMIVPPEAVEDHCNKENECVHNDLEYELCEECDGFFDSPEALLEHKKDEEAGVRFRIIRFNGENDLPINRALRNLRPNSQLLEVNSQTDRCSTVEPDTDRNRNEVHENQINNITRYCQDCDRSVPISDFEGHESAHRDEFIAAIENGEFQSSDEEEQHNNESNNALDDTPGEIDVDENAMCNNNSISNRIVSLNYTFVEHNMREDRENPSISNIALDKTEMVSYKEHSSINNSEEKVSALSEEGSVSNNSKEEHINEQAIDAETNVILETANTQLDEEESIRNILQIDIGQASENQTSTRLNADESFRPIENDSRQNLHVNPSKQFIVTDSVTIDISDETEYENDEELIRSTTSIPTVNISEEGSFSNNSKRVEHINVQTMDHVNSPTCYNPNTNVILQTASTQLDEDENIPNTTLQIDIGQASENQTSTGLKTDESIRPPENDSRQDVLENSSMKLNITISDTIYISDESEYENDEEFKPTSDPNRALKLEEVDEALDDKSKINRINISAINNEQSNEIIDLTDECEYDERAITLQDLSDDLDDEITAERIKNEHQLFMEMEQKIKESLSKRD